MTMFIRYIEEARLTIFRAKHEADRFGALEIAPEHILLGLLKDPVLINQTMKGISEKEMRETIDAHLREHEPNTLPHDLPLSQPVRRWSWQKERLTSLDMPEYGTNIFC